MNLKAKLYGLAILAIILLFVWLMIRDDKAKSYLYTDFGVDLPENFQSIGIDVSHYQGEINWREVSKMNIDGDSIDFVFIKCTEGGSLHDEKCELNSVGAADAGIYFGLYHFFIPEVSAREQAVFFAEKCDLYADSLRPVLDIEVRNKFTSKRMIDSVSVFLDTYEKIGLTRPLIYTNESYFNDYFSESYLKFERFWIANYNGECDAMALENVYIWQFSESGTVNGISEKVDLNVAKPDFWKEIFLY